MKLIKEISWEEVMLEWLRTEWYGGRFDGIRNMLDPSEMHASAKDAFLISVLLYMERHTILNEIPLSTTRWYYAEIKTSEFEKINVISEGTWHYMFSGVRNIKKVSDMFFTQNYTTSAPGSNEHKRKISQIIDKIKGGHNLFYQLILIKKKGSSRLAILEGNHRAVAFQVTGKIPPKVIVGISPDMDQCIWHRV